MCSTNSAFFMSVKSASIANFQPTTLCAYYSTDHFFILLVASCFATWETRWLHWCPAMPGSQLWDVIWYTFIHISFLHFLSYGWWWPVHLSFLKILLANRWCLPFISMFLYFTWLMLKSHAFSSAITLYLVTFEPFIDAQKCTLNFSLQMLKVSHSLDSLFHMLKP